MRSIESCWEYLCSATSDQVIVALGGKAYDIMPITPKSRGESFLETSPDRIVGVYSPGTELSFILDDVEVLEGVSSSFRK
ncbi:MAG: hypothetical protein JWM78_1538 [Verrucomicrobiaceae bacterium]|nr:hypothetical protein [Verrucomicrobiaceae bacterium]